MSYTPAPAPTRNIMPWVLLGILGVFALLFISGYVSGNNRGVSFENKIEATYKDNQNILSNYATQLAEAAQVPAQYKEDFKELMKAEMEGRYGSPDKARTAMANWIQERQLSFDSSLYAKLQAMIEAGRNKFAHGQTKLLDEKRAYETALGNIPGGWFLAMAGFPKKDLSKFDIIVTSETSQKFDSKTDSAIDVFGKKK